MRVCGSLRAPLRSRYASFKTAPFDRSGTPPTGQTTARAERNLDTGYASWDRQTLLDGCALAAVGAEFVVGRVTGLWVYQTLGQRPDPEVVAARAQQHGFRWLTAQATEGETVLDQEWLRGMRRATRARNMRLAVHGFLGRPHPKPVAEARAMAKAIDVAEADFAIVNAEIQYENAVGPCRSSSSTPIAT